MSDIAKCFISYCQEDTPSEAVQEIVNSLRKMSEGRVFFYFDRDNEAGVDLKEFMDNISYCDSVVIIASPKYKERASTEGENVYYEFSLIKQKYDAYMMKKKDPLYRDQLSRYSFAIFPIIVDGLDSDNKTGKKDAYPDYLDEHRIIYKRYIYASSKLRKDIKSVKASSGAKHSDYEKKLIQYGKIIKRVDNENKSIIRSIASRTLAIKLSRPIPSENRSERIQKLIEFTKAEVNGNLGEIFCRTRFYDELEHQTRKVFVGRKGSGKSQTILQFIDERNSLYKGVMKIDANNINLYTLLEDLIYNPSAIATKISSTLHIDNTDSNLNGIKDDISNLFSYEELLRYVWFGYIYLYCIYIIAVEDENGNLIPSQKANFKKAKSFINKLLQRKTKKERWDNSPEISSALYSYAFYTALSFYNSIIMKSRNDNMAYVYADIRIMNTLKNYLKELLLDEKTLNSFIKTFRSCTKKIFLCLDGFDNIQEEQRGVRFNFETKSGDTQLITRFETIWITSLVDVIYQINSSPNNPEMNLLYQHMDICLMVPFDRYIQASYDKRDGFVYRDLMSSVNYNGVDLCNLFTKRIQVIAGLSVKCRQTTFEEVFIAQEEALNCFPNLKKTVSITLKNNQKVSFPLFLMLLRYSFWRPRDIIDHIRAVFQTVIRGESFNTTIDDDMIIESLAISTGDIILKTIEEFKDLWINIRECLEKIYYKRIIMTYNEFDSFLKTNGFNINLSNGEYYADTKEIIKFLYRIGFIGIVLSSSNMSSMHTHYKQHQIFYSGIRILRDINAESFKENLVFFNPVFHFSYSLTIDTNEVLGISNWEELNSRDAFRGLDYL